MWTMQCIEENDSKSNISCSAFYNIGMLHYSYKVQKEDGALKTVCKKVCLLHLLITWA